MRGRRRGTALSALLALLLLAGVEAGRARAQEAADGPSAQVAERDTPRTEIPVTPLFVLRESGPVPLEEDGLHPGELLGLRVDWPEGPPEGRIELGAPGANLGQVVALRLVPEDPRAEGATVVEVLVLGLGETELPSIPLRLPDGTLVGTAPFTLETIGALEEDDQEPAPARAQARMGLEAWGLAAGVLAVCLPIALLVVWLLWRRRRPSPEAPAAPAEPPEPPEVWAHRSLDELLDSELLAHGRMKEFHIRLAEIAKEYLSRRYHLHLVERTTYECPAELRRAGVETALAREIGRWLEAIDLVKFAGEHPPSPQVVSSAQALREMIDRTTPKPEPPELPAAAGSGGSEG